MSMYHAGLVTGFVCVFLLIAVMAAVFRKSRIGEGSEYDERQELLRGR